MTEEKKAPIFCPFTVTNEEYQRARCCEEACALWIKYLDHPEKVPGACSIKQIAEVFTGTAAFWIQKQKEVKVQLPFDPRNLRS